MMIAAREVSTDQETRILGVTWADGHVSEIPYDALRDMCPCARCRTARVEGRKTLRMALSTKLLSWKRVGNYAINLAWGDSHDEGIFAYDYLRGLCPCGDCELPERYL